MDGQISIKEKRERYSFKVCPAQCRDDTAVVANRTMVLRNNPNQNVYFIPAYLTLLVKNLMDLNPTMGILDINFTLILRIKKGGVPGIIIDRLRDGIVLRINDEQFPISTQDSNRVTVIENDELLVFTVRAR